MKIKRVKNLRGKIELPGDKSISHRAAIFSAMANGKTKIANFATSADCGSTLSCLQALGVEIVRDGNLVTVAGVGKNGFSHPSDELDCGNSGTTMRLMAGVLAGQRFSSMLTGDKSLQSRPMKRVIAPLSLMGAAIKANNAMAPLEIVGNNPLKAIEYELPVASAQIKSCVLLAGLNADGETSVIEKTQTRDHTERMLRWFGVDVKKDGERISLSGNAHLTANDLTVPADISSAAFFLVAAVCLAGSAIELPNVGLNPSRTAVVEVLQKFGSNIVISNLRREANEPVGDILVTGGHPLGEKNNLIDGEIIANLIDEIPILAILGTQLDGGLEIRDASELRVKESDRIAAIVENLRRMNADVEEFADGFRVGRSALLGGKVEAFGDHRIAMAFAIAGLFAEGETEISGGECAAVSFPAFFETLQGVIRY